VSSGRLRQAAPLPRVIGVWRFLAAARQARVAGLRQKPNAFDILDAERGVAMVYRAGEIEERLEQAAPVPVLDMALDDVG